MVVKKNGKKTLAQASNAAETIGAHAAMSGTLEDYFNRKKTYQTDQMKELNKEVTKHLLTGTGENNAMVMEKSGDDEDEDDGNAASDAKRAEPDQDADAKAMAKAVDEKEEIDEEDDGAKPMGRRVSSDSDEPDDYEDDYESDSSMSAAAVATGGTTSVAGMTLGEYLHAKGDGVLPSAAASAAIMKSSSHYHKADAKHHHDKLPQKPIATHHSTTVKPLPPAVISGMSLDYYLGANGNGSGDGDAGLPPKKKKPSHTKLKQPAKALAALPVRAAHKEEHEYAEDEEAGGGQYKTPFVQRQMKKKKKQQQLNSTSSSTSGSVAKSILLGESPSQSQFLQTRHLSTNTTVTTTTPPLKERKKPQASSSGTSGSQPPLPKLLGSSASAHGFVLPTGQHHRDGEDNDSDEAADEKLPLLQHLHASASVAAASK